MGELVQSTASEWIDQVDAIRSDLIATATSGNRLKAAVAQAEGRHALLKTLQQESARALMLRLTDPDVAMVELVNHPSEDDRIRICAVALLSGFCPGNEQFSIFGAGRDKQGVARPGKLYIKEAGYRTLFGHLGIVPHVSTGHPEFTTLGKTGKKAWLVTGEATCEFNGEKYSVSFEQAPLGIPGYESDNVAGIAAKARRRMLQALWQSVSPILNTDAADDADGVEVVTAEVGAITQQAATVTVDEAATWDAEYARITSPRAQDAWEALLIADTASRIDLIVNALGKEDMTTKDRDSVKRFAEHRRSEVQG